MPILVSLRVDRMGRKTKRKETERPREKSSVYSKFKQSQGRKWPGLTLDIEPVPQA